MYVVAYKVLVVQNFAGFKSNLINRLFVDLFGQNLKSYVVLTHEDQLHLVKNKVDLLFVLEGAIGLDLNFLNNFAGLFNFAIEFVHLHELLGYLGVLSFEDHLAVGDFTQHSQHIESFFAGG